MSNQFLAATKIGRYLTRLIDQAPITSGIPSTAKHLNYADADKLVQRLKSAGFPEAHVCTIKGLPATPEDIWESDSVCAAPQESPAKQ